MPPAAANAQPANSAAERTRAERLVGELASFYTTFKDILAQGWSLLNNAEVEDAVKLVAKHAR